MFWRVASFAQSSPIDAILDKQSFTLEELLEEDEIIQEVKSLNTRLIAFMKQHEQVEALITLIVKQPSGGSDSEGSSPRNQQPVPLQQQLIRPRKMPRTACEVFCCEPESIIGTLIESPELMDLLFSFLQSPKPLDCTLAGYWARVLQILLVKRSGDVYGFCRSRPELLDQLVGHMDTFSIMESLVKLVGADEQISNYASAEQLEWLRDTTLMQMLLDRLDVKYSHDVREHAGEVLAAIARAHSSPLTASLTSEAYLQPLMERAFAPEQDHGLVQALNVCIALLDRQPAQAPPQPEAPNTGWSTPVPGSPAVPVSVPPLPADKLLALLETPSEGQDGVPEQETTYGMLKPPLGSTRLTAIALVAVLLRTGQQVAEQAVMASGLLRRSLELFLQFPFNSILHHQVTSILCVALDGAGPELLQHLFHDCQLEQWLVTAPVIVANKLQEVVRLRPEVRSLLEGNEEWQQYAATALRERNEVENVNRWACGRPQARLSIPAGDSDGEDIFQDELNLDALNGDFASNTQAASGAATGR
eukprot:jgi/Astpho2/136/e_gw1.00004.6.1_t